MKTDKDGFFINESREEKIPQAFRETIEHVKTQLVELLGDNLHSIYLRGSVPLGTAIPGISDLDLLLFVKERIDDSALPSLYKMRDPQYVDPAIFTRVDFSVFPLSALPLSTQADSYHPQKVRVENYNLAFTIKTQCLSIYGENLAEKIPPFKPCTELAFSTIISAFDVFKYADNHLKTPETAHSANLPQHISKIMKSIIRKSFAFVLIKENTFTRDLGLCCELFCKHYPQWEDEMKKVLGWTLEPPDSPHEVLEFLADYKKWFTEEFDKTFENA